MTEPLIQTTDLSRTFQALRNRDPLKLERQIVPTHPDYRRVPSSNYSPITSVNTGSWGNGMARFASSSGIVYGQPQFFSPVHTPINWQIPSKRLEEYQWMYLPNTQVLREDFTYESIENNIFSCNNIIDDDVTGGFIFETDNYPKILNSEGKFNRPPRIGMRECENKKCFSIATIGNYGIIKVSEEHNLFVLDGNIHRRNKKVLGNKKYRESKGIKPNGVEKVKIQDRLIKKIKAQDVSKLDYLLTPVPKIGEVSIDKDLAWLIGFCVADGCIYEKDGSYSVRFTGYKDEKALLHCKEILEKKFDGKITSKPHGDGKGWRINASTKKAYSFFRRYILNKGIEKKFSKEIFDLDRESRLYILAGYFDGDGCYEKGQRKLVSSCYSKDLADQTYWLLISCQISASIGKCAISKNHYPTSSECFYRVIIPSPEVSNISKYMNSNKVPLDFISKKERLLKFFYTEDGITYLTNPINEIKEFLYTGKGFDIEMTNERRALVADGYIGSNCRFFYSNEPKIGAAIDFYSEFPMSNWEHECRNRTVKLYFDRLKEKLKLQKWCRLISHEVHLLGDCFPFIEVDCPVCNGSGRIGSDICEHDGGTVRRVIILNPDYVEVLSSPLNPDPIIALRPDEELINMVQRKTPGYEKLSTEVRKLIAAGQPIKLDNTSVSHLKYGENGYAKYGIGMVRRLFPILSYKTKLMVAQWIVAERLIVPIKIVKVGSDERPAGPADIAAVQAQLAQTANDPNLTIVTHHAFEMDFVGACHDRETEVLTKDGWKLFKDASIKDKIGTYNLDSGKLEYQIPTERQEYDYDGEMYEFSGKHVNVKVTPNHMMLASKKEDSLSEKFEKVRADQISIKDKFIVTDVNNILEEKSHETVDLISISNYKGKVYCFTVPNGYIITRRNGRVGIHGNSGKVLTLSNEFELINQEILDGMMINNALLNGEGPNFSAAAVGIEAMIQRLKTFREQVTDWLREAIYIPEARRQAAAGNEAFITKNDDTGEEEVVVPKIKWDNMHLRDQQQFRTFVMQLYEKGLLSAQTVLETFDFDPDQEIERKRYDALQMVALGQGLQGGMGGAGGGGDMGGGMGGLPSPGGGGEPPIGAPDMGGPGTPSEGPSAPTGGGPAIAKSSSITATQVDPSQFGGRVLKKRTRERILSEQQKQQRMYEVQQNQKKRVMDAASGGNGGTERDEKGRIINTKAERDLIPHLKKAHQDGLFGNYAIVKQFRVQAQDQEYPLDFAIPSLKIGIEADGEIFHSAPKQKAHDKERDMKLSQQGWTIVRFTDEEIEKNPQMVVQSIIKTFMQKQLYVKNMAKGQEGQPQ